MKEGSLCITQSYQNVNLLIYLAIHSSTWLESEKQLS